MEAKKELQIKIQARRVYVWLLFSPILTAPCLVYGGFNISYRAGFGERLGMIASPLIFHLVLVVWLTSPHLFVRRHAQQGVILVGLRFLSALLLLGSSAYIDEYVTLFVWVNGALVFLGSMWGIRQVRRGENSLMAWQGEGDQLPSGRDIGTLQRAMRAQGRPTSAEQKALNQSSEAVGKLWIGKNLIANNSPDLAARHFAEAFRNGDRETRAEALKYLETLGEVEEF